MSLEELRGEIVKLEITPTPVNNFTTLLNPFFLEDIKEKPQQNNRQSNCRRCRRRSESQKDEFKDQQTSLAPDKITKKSHSIPGVYKQILKRNSYSSRKVLREPVLRALQFHTHVCQKRTKNENLTDEPPNELAPCDSLFVKDMPNFHDLINECQTLLNHDVKLHGFVPPHQSLNRRRTTNSFTTLRLDRVPRKSLRKSSTCPEYGLQRNTTSCSQQAGSATNCDDVTIDELASYFDTFVHIPKKMSSMAELMYL